jgi:hypothetical protein
MLKVINSLSKTTTRPTTMVTECINLVFKNNIIRMKTFKRISPHKSSHSSIMPQVLLSNRLLWPKTVASNTKSLSTERRVHRMFGNSNNLVPLLVIKMSARVKEKWSTEPRPLTISDCINTL